MGAMNELIDASAISGLRRRLDVATGGRPLAALSTVSASLGDLSLRERTDLVAAAILSDLPDDYESVAAIFRTALSDESFRGWTMWPVSESAVTLALTSSNPAAFDDALALLAELTPRLTSEFAIRRLLEADYPRAISIVRQFAASDDEHVRRLASEGTRAFLPWAIRVRSVLADPRAAVPILDALYRDESDYVRRSVANHVNDLSRQNPELVVDLAGRWLADPDENTARLVRHALRTLIKRGDPAALALLGFAPATVSVTEAILDRAIVELPGSLGFSVDVTNDATASARLVVDYVIHFAKSNGTLAHKVFKLAAVTVAPGETVTLSKRHAFRQMTTRVHYSGIHALEVQVNGERYSRAEFSLVV